MSVRKAPHPDHVPEARRHFHSVRRALAVSLLGVLAACGSASSPASQPDPTAIAAPSDVELRGCVDATLSSDASFAPSFQRVLAAGLKELAAAGAPQDTEVPALPPFSIVLRQVTAASFSTDAPRLEVTVPGTIGLPAPPTAEDPDLAEHGVTWTDLQATRTAQLTERARAARDASQQLRSWSLDRAGSSQIHNCLAALADGATSATRLLVASDLSDNAGRDEQVGAVDLHGATVSVIQSCPADDPTLCPRRLSSFRRWVTEHHGRLGDVGRADDMTSAVTTWLDVTR